MVVDNSIIKDSDIDRDVRVTGFLNAEALDFSNLARKKATARLVDQIFIRREVRVGGYPGVTPREADVQLAALKKDRFKTTAAFNAELRKYGLDELTLRSQFEWQLTVLRFIDLRFKPAVLVTDEEIEKYYRAHPVKASTGKTSLADRHDEISDILSAEKVNKVFFAWLDDQRKEAKIQYRESSLA